MPPKQPKGPLELKLDAIDRTLEVHSTRMEAIDQKLDRTAALIEANTQQVATLSEGLTRLENNLNRLESLIERGFQDFNQRLDRLAGITEQQSQIAASLAATVASLVQRVA
jgi:archaellum component FlaC